MGDWPSRTDAWGNQTTVIYPWSALSCGPGLREAHNNGAPLSTGWGAANRAVLVPFRLPKTMVAYQMVVGNGATASGNFDCGIYDSAGNRIVSGGATGKVATQEVVVNIADTTLGWGTYYLAVSVDGTANMTATTLTNLHWAKMFGIMQASSAYTLPATVTIETKADGIVPHAGIWFRSQ